MRAPAPGSGTTLAIAVGIVALALATFEVAGRYVPRTWIQRDGRFYINVNTTLVERASVDQGEFCASWYEKSLGWNHNLDVSWSNVAVGRDGTRLPKHPILLPLLSTPLFWAFGFGGALVFNLLLFALIAGAAFAIARRHGSMAAAAFAAIALPFGTGIRDHAYDYHIDVLMLALFACGMALAYARRGVWAGIFIGLCAVLRPTALIWLPSLVLILAERRDWRTLWRALAGGTIPLALFALSNWWLYGMPWWSGYNRVLVMVNGEPQIADVSDAFSVPFDRGLEALWSGGYGVRHRLTLVFASIPGLFFLLRRRPLYVVAAVLGVGASIVLFARYQWYGDRFLWPSCALLVPALASSFDTIARAIRKRPHWRAPLIAALASIVIVIAKTAVRGPDHHFTEEELRDLAMHLSLTGVLCAAMTRAAERAGAGSIAILAPLLFVLLPEVRERIATGGDDLYVATAVCVALGARHWIVALLASVVAGYLALGHEGDPTAIFASLSEGPGRAVLAVLISGAIALVFVPRYIVYIAPLLLLFVPQIAGLGGARFPLFALAVLAIPIPAACARAADLVMRVWRRTSVGKRALAAISLLALLAAIGLTRRTLEPPFHLASYEAMRRARVFVGEVPCDMLAWEHMNWECAISDRGEVHGETGFATSSPLHVGGVDRSLFLIATQQGRARTVRWHDVEATATLSLRYAIPDELRGGGTLIVRIDGHELASLTLPPAPDGTIHSERLSTRAYDGRKVTLELELRGGRAVVVDGEFVR